MLEMVLDGAVAMKFHDDGTDTLMDKNLEEQLVKDANGDNINLKLDIKD